jgi:hypothetical protein
MREILKNRKWQLLCLVLTIALIFSVSLNIYQSLNASNNGSGGNPSSSSNASEQMNFTFTWGPETQKIVQGEFRLKVSIRFGGGGMVPANESVIIVIEANDDDYEEWDYVGLVFDTNQNGHIDIRDISIALYANNMTQPSVLVEHGFLGFAQIMPTPGPQKVTFNPDRGYTFTAQIPCEQHPLNLPLYLKKGDNNPLHLCFYDKDVADYMGVFIRFLFYLP